MIKAVLFDLGGVILPSPYVSIRKYYEENGFQSAGVTFQDFIRVVHVQDSSRHLISLFETDNIHFETFCQKLDRVVHSQEPTSIWNKFDTKAYFRNIDQFVAQPNQKMLSLVNYLRSNCKLRVGVITNNWFSYNRPVDNSQDEFFCFKDLEFYSKLQQHFDFIIESRIVKVRKPDPSIFQLVLHGLKIQSNEALFIDDLGINLKSASKMGMKTIQCVSVEQAIQDICQQVGIFESSLLDALACKM